MLSVEDRLMGLRIKNVKFHLIGAFNLKAQLAVTVQNPFENDSGGGFTDHPICKLRVADHSTGLRHPRDGAKSLIIGKKKMIGVANLFPIASPWYDVGL